MNWFQRWQRGIFFWVHWGFCWARREMRLNIFVDKRMTQRLHQGDGAEELRIAMGGYSRGSVRFFALLALLFGALAGCGPVWANGNVSADEVPPPVRKSVKRAPIKKAAPKARKTKKKTPSAPVRKKAVPSRPRISSLRQGIALMREERYEAAYPWLQKAVQEERRNPEAWYWYGMYHERTAQFEQAQFFYRKAMELDPGFEPFSRVVVYPGDGERVPLWDPKRPARVYPIPTNDHGIATIPPDSPQARRRPVRPPIDPELPKVPLYTPPEPGAGPFDGDAWQPSVYVPPGRERLLEGGEPAYAPPESRVVPLAPPPALKVGVAFPAGGNPITEIFGLQDDDFQGSKITRKLADT